MAPQTSPKYADVTSVANPILSKTLTERYHRANVVWPIVLIQDNAIVSYLYERSKKNTINDSDDNRPQSSSGLGSHFIDYSSYPRLIVPTSSLLEPFVSPEFTCSYEYVVSSPYSTVDIDYAWNTGKRWKGIELTTFWMEFTNQNRAEDLISKLHRRPSWQGPEGPHGLRKIVEAAQDLELSLHMVCVNTLGKVSNQFKTDGNVYRFPLSPAQIDRLVQGAVPEKGVFSTFAEFLEWL